MSIFKHYSEKMYEHTTYRDSARGRISLTSMRPLTDSKYDSFGRRAQRFEHRIFEGSGKSIGGMSEGRLKTGLGYGQSGASWMRNRYLKMSGFGSITEGISYNLDPKTLFGYTKGAGVMKNALGSLGGFIPGSLLGGGIMYATGMEDSITGALTEGALMEASFRLAAPVGSGLGAMMKGGIGWSILGSTLGLSTGQTLAAQGAVYMAGGRAAVGAIGVGSLYASLAGYAAYYGGKAMYEGAKALHNVGAKVRRTDFSSGDMSYATANAATMRQQALGAIQKSHMNARSMLGNEGLTYARAIGE